MDDTREVIIPFTTSVRCLVQPARVPRPSGRPPLFVSLHGQGQSGERQRRWMGPAVPDGFCAAFPDGLHKNEVHRAGRPRRIGHAWYLYTGDRPALVASLQESESALWRLVDRAADATGANPDRVWLAGFSQGGYLVHYAAMRSPARVAGWVGQAGGFRMEYLGDERPALGGRPVLLQHGRRDEAIGPEAAEAIARTLREHGADVTLRLYDAGHVITPEMASDVRAWLEAHAGR